jgi:hypothetical protein
MDADRDFIAARFHAPEESPRDGGKWSWGLWKRPREITKKGRAKNGEVRKSQGGRIPWSRDLGKRPPWKLIETAAERDAGWRN